MRKMFAACFMFALFCGSAGAQDQFKKPWQSGYFFVAPGSISINTDSQSSVQVGGGYEGFIYKGLGMEFDAGAFYVAPRYVNSRKWTGMLSLDAVYDFQRSDKQKLSPFIAVGLTAIPAFDVSAGYNFGGGIKYWLQERIGLKAEFRFHVRPGQLRTYQDIQSRIGVAFR
jgi:hypothetical protein